jgi:hypothetical protein
MQLDRLDKVNAFDECVGVIKLSDFDSETTEESADDVDTGDVHAARLFLLF